MILRRWSHLWVTLDASVSISLFAYGDGRVYHLLLAKLQTLCGFVNKTHILGRSPLPHSTQFTPVVFILTVNRLALHSIVFSHGDSRALFHSFPFLEILGLFLIRTVQSSSSVHFATGLVTFALAHIQFSEVAANCVSINWGALPVSSPLLPPLSLLQAPTFKNSSQYAALVEQTTSLYI